MPVRSREPAKKRASGGGARSRKRPFEIALALPRIRKAVEPFPKAAMFELAAEGFGSPFEQLVACIISIRTRDEVSLPTARRLFEVARTPREIAKLTPAQIDRLIGDCTFHLRSPSCVS